MSVGARGFEPPTFRSRTERAARLRHAPNCLPLPAIKAAKIITNEGSRHRIMHEFLLDRSVASHPQAHRNYSMLDRCMVRLRGEDRRRSLFSRDSHRLCRQPSEFRRK